MIRALRADGWELVRVKGSHHHFAHPVKPGLAIALEVRWARQDAGLSQAELAERAGVSQQQIAKLESPEGNPSVATIAKIARALGLRPVVELARGVVPVGLAKKRRMA